MRVTQRAAGLLPAHAFKTYSVKMPIASHFRPATCADVECRAMTYGWKTTIDITKELGQKQSHYIEHQSGRRFIKHALGQGMVEYSFPPGQRCFGRHVMSLEREPLFIVRNGSRRAARGDVRRHANGDDWVDDMSAHLDRIRNQ